MDPDKRPMSPQDDPETSTNAADAAAWPPEESRHQLAGIVTSIFAVLLFVFLGVVVWQWRMGKKGAYCEREKQREGETGVELEEGKGGSAREGVAGTASGDGGGKEVGKEGDENGRGSGNGSGDATRERANHDNKEVKDG
ncbi:hypothetical protein OQA88_1155 [Cercophora sp. LCS_1]